MMIIGHGLLNTRVVPFLVTGPVQQKPLPRAACAAFPSPWERGVNGLANYGLIALSSSRRVVARLSLYFA